jgi:putative tricarboxylic transport membrane protein
MHSPRFRLPGELVFSLLLVGFSVFMLWQAYAISKFESLSSAGAFPMFATLVMVVTGVMIAGQTARAKPLPANPGEALLQQFVRQITPAVLVLFVVAIAAYMLLLERLGFVVSSYLFLVASMGLLGSRRLLFNLGVSALSLVAIYIIFQTAFSVVLPSGTWLQGWLK